MIDKGSKEQHVRQRKRWNVQTCIWKVQSDLKGPCACLNMCLATFIIQGECIWQIKYMALKLGVNDYTLMIQAQMMHKSQAQMK
jgi:hypothetical protein